MAGRTHRERGRLVVLASGEVDVTTSPLLQDRIDQALAENPRASTLVIDMAAVTFIDSSGVKCLMRAYKAMLGRGGHVIVRDAGPPVMRVLDLVGLGQLFEVQPAPSTVPPAAAS